MNLVEGIGIDIVQAEHEGEYRLRLTFSDGVERLVDFGPFLRHSAHPAIRSFLDSSKFMGFKVEQGDLLWDDYDLCFPVADLYEGHI